MSDTDAKETQESKEAFKDLKDYGMKRDIVLQVKDAFEYLDKNRDGNLSFDEVKTLLTMLNQNPTDKDVKEMFDAADINKDKTLSELEYKELIAGHLKSREQIEEELRKAFRVFDSDGNGSLDYRELNIALKKLGEPLDDDEIRELFDEMKATTDNNQVNIDAFVKTMCGSMYEL